MAHAFTAFLFPHSPIPLFVFFLNPHSFLFLLLFTDLPTSQLQLLISSFSEFIQLPCARTNLPAMFISFISLVLASAISAKVIDIQVSDDNASLAFTPEAIVSSNCHDLHISAIDHPSAVCRSRRSGHLPFQSQEPHCDPVVVCRSLFPQSGRF